MRYAEIIGEDGFEEIRLQAINSKLDTVKNRRKNLSSNDEKTDLKRQQKKLQVDKARVKLQAKQRDLLADKTK